MAPANSDSESELAIAFDRVIFKNGLEVSLNVAIQAMTAAQTTASAMDADMDTMGSAGAGAAGSGMAGACGRRRSNLRSR